MMFMAVCFCGSLYLQYTKAVPTDEDSVFRTLSMTNDLRLHLSKGKKIWCGHHTQVQFYLRLLIGISLDTVS